MTHVVGESLGWGATGVFVASYFVPPARMRAAQMIGALLWLAYGVAIGSSPVIVANVLVFSAAAWTAFRKASAKQIQP